MNPLGHLLHFPLYVSGIRMQIFDNLVDLFLIFHLISSQCLPGPIQLGVDGEVLSIQPVRYCIKAERAIFHRVGAPVAGADPHVVEGVACITISKTEIQESVEVCNMVTAHAVCLNRDEHVPATESTNQHWAFAEVVKTAGAVSFTLHVEKVPSE